MSFKISGDAQEWFRRINYTPARVMDAYYMCLILGLHMFLKNKKNKLPERVVGCMEKAFLQSAYPDYYKGKKYELIALFLEAELSRSMGNERADKDVVKEIINSRLDSEDPSKLSEKGLDFCDRYSYMGFLEIKKKIPEKPFDKTVFLDSYNKILNEYL